MPDKLKKIRSVFILYWFLLAYIIAALIWWYIALTRQNEQMTAYKLHRLQKEDTHYQEQYANILTEEKRKRNQYIGEGSIFFLLIGAGAIFVYRAVSRQLKISQQQQNFMMAITHELKTPLAITQLNLETLQKRKLDEQQQQKLLQNTLQEANRMNTLCNNMLLSSQIETGGYQISAETLDVGELTNNCVQDFIKRFPGRPIKYETQKDLYISGDKLLLQMAVNNLLDNAIKYSPKESTITVMATCKENEITLAIADKGAGIGENEKKKIFEKHYRAGNESTKKAKGTGLGLYIVGKIVAAHHGHISVANNIPMGSIFSIHLKRVK